MSIRKTSFVPGEYYHIYNRGNSKQKIFLSKKDYERFVALLYGINTNESFNFFNLEKGGGIFLREIENPLVSIGAYCLMPNHFHLLITPLSEEGLRKFKSIHMKTDKQLKYLFSYIHLNPVKFINRKWKEKGIRNLKTTFEFLNTYLYSSFLDYSGQNRRENLIIDPRDFPDYFSSKDSFKEEIIDWLRYKEKS